jgi:hypothetical protein
MTNCLPDNAALRRLADRLRQLSLAVTEGRKAVSREFTMRIPAEPERDADLVLSTASDCLRKFADYRQENPAQRDDVARLNFISDNDYSLVSCDEPTGGGDSDVRWEVHAAHMTPPQVRVYGIGSTARDAIDAAMAHVEAHGPYAPCIHQSEAS